jgi:hypothetical protein
MRLLFLPFLVVAATGVSSACTSATPTAACQTYVVPASTDLTKPTVSFQNDVLPILVQSCAFTSCHGASSGGNNGIKLGSKTQPNDPVAIRAGFVGVKAPELPTMNFVTAGDTSQSYVMHKLDGDQCKLDAQCTKASCQSSMPQNGDVLPVATRDTIRRWIAQGALEN